MAWAPGLTIECERSIRTLNRVRVLVARGRASAKSAVAPTDIRSDVNEAGLVRAFSVLESYLEARGDVLLHRDLPIPSKPTSLSSYVHDRVIGGLRGSFDRRVGYWTAGLGVKLSTYRGWSQVTEYKDLRNTIVHAVGFVRPDGEELKAGIRKRLARVTADPENYVGRVPVSDKDFDDLAAIVEEFVVWVDRQRP